MKLSLALVLVGLACLVKADVHKEFELFKIRHGKAYRTAVEVLIVGSFENEYLMLSLAALQEEGHLC